MLAVKVRFASDTTPTSKVPCITIDDGRLSAAAATISATVRLSRVQDEEKPGGTQRLCCVVRGSSGIRNYGALKVVIDRSCRGSKASGNIELYADGVVFSLFGIAAISCARSRVQG